MEQGGFEWEVNLIVETVNLRRVTVMACARAQGSATAVVVQKGACERGESNFRGDNRQNEQACEYADQSVLKKCGRVLEWARVLVALPPIDAS
jgi:hypothetical protein